jgi:hypothetical protein
MKAHIKDCIRGIRHSHIAQNRILSYTAAKISKLTRFILFKYTTSYSPPNIIFNPWITDWVQNVSGLVFSSTVLGGIVNSLLS